VDEFLQFVVIGLGLGAVYSLLAGGVIAIYRGSGVVNFAHGTMALVGAIVYYELNAHSGVPVIPAVILAVLAGMTFGLLVQIVIMRRLSGAAPITRVVATLGVLTAVQAAAALHYQDSADPVNVFLPQHQWDAAGVIVQSDRIFLLVIAFLVTGGLWFAQEKMKVGLATLAAAENEFVAESLGWSANLLGMVNWALGGALAGLAGALVVPYTGLSVSILSLLVVPALTAALLGRFNLWGAFLGALAVGIAQSLIINYVHITGASDAFPFLLIIIAVVATGRALPARSFISERLPRLGSGRIRPVPAVIALVAGVFLMGAVFNLNWQADFTNTLAFAIVLLSVVLLTGYAGQLSLAQYALAGVGAFIAGRLAATTGVPFWACLAIGIVGTVPIGALFALPALRTRGVTLSIVTFGLGIAIYSLVFNNASYTGGSLGTDVNNPNLFGWAIDSLDHPARYGMVCVVAFALAAAVITNIRRSAVGRRMVAIRENERAAASLGVSVVQTKLYAFSVAAAIASVGGILIAFNNFRIIYTDFSPTQSIYTTGFAIVGGVGYVLGPLLGGVLVQGGVGALLNGVLNGIQNYLVLIGGCGVILTVIIHPDGIIAAYSTGVRRLERLLFRSQDHESDVQRAQRIATKLYAGAAALEPGSADESRQSGTQQGTLEVRNLTVRFGQVRAVGNVSLTVRPGEIVGLIGPNGAGKTTLIDCVTGFVKASEGEISLGDRRLTRVSTPSRVHAGVARSWQSLELFDDLTVMENLQIASETAERSWFDDLRALVWPRKVPLTASGAAAIREFELENDLGRKPTDLPYGRRRLLGIARAMALNPGLLMLDEPAAGLGDHETDELGHLIRRLASTRQMGILLVEHDVELVLSVCHRIVVLNFGEVIATGTPDEIRSDPAVITAYLGAKEETDESVAAVGASPLQGVVDPATAPGGGNP
jgi:ABC-type branched-subunit amino acid transport system ATPase component/ABC-type branched-subunit amino acid transport system permease subunit